jgi:hypothetical protein
MSAFNIIGPLGRTLLRDKQQTNAKQNEIADHSRNETGPRAQRQKPLTAKIAKKFRKGRKENRELDLLCVLCGLPLRPLRLKALL